ncbi:MAG: OmpA family protein [Cellvibrionaceae bacterium]|nr:OmpA family protein [Cellvibrionaceae bacterium]
MTPIESVKWQAQGSKFSCRLSHFVEGFGEAIFEREAGETTRFYLDSKTPRMKTGAASLVIRAPAWSPQSAKFATSQLASVKVKESTQPIMLGRQLAERMLAELQKGMLLDFNRRPWYGDSVSVKVTLPSIGFRASHQQYVDCLANLLPVNFKQVERSSLFYSNDDDELTDAVKRRLDKVIAYVKEDAAVKSFYLDGHTDSEGIRNENLLKSQRRTEKVMDYLIEKQIPREQIVARWHGERYPVDTNRTAKGRAKNRRVTLRLSKEPPQTLVKSAAEI